MFMNIQWPGILAFMYPRDLLLGLKRVWCQLPESAVSAIRVLGLRRHRGVRAGLIGTGPMCYSRQAVFVTNLLSAHQK